MISEFLFLDGIRNKFPFIIISHCSNETNFFTFDIFCPEIFWNLSLVSFDDFVRCRYNTLSAPVILFQFHDFHILIVFLKLQNIFDGSAPETINALGVITDHTYVFINRSQEFYNLVLRRIGILELIDQDIFKLVLIFMQAFRKIFKKLIKLEQQVIKIHGPVLETSFGIGLINLGYGRPVAADIFLLNIIIGRIFYGCNQSVFGLRNPVINNIGFIVLIIQIEFIDNRLHNAFS